MEPIAVPESKARRSERAFERCQKWLCSKYASAGLAVISFVESVFAPIIIDPFLIALILAKREKWKRYIFVSIVASTVGGIFAYVLGALFFDTLGAKLITFYQLEEEFASIARSLDKNGFVFVFLGAFTPIPYKIVALASGVLHIHIFTFIIASIIGRTLRLGLVGLAAYAASPRILPTIQRNLHLFAAIVGLLLALYIAIEVFIR